MNNDDNVRIIINNNEEDGVVPADPIPEWFHEQCHRIRDDEHCRIQNLNLNIRRLSLPMIVLLAEALRENTSIQVLNLTSSLSVTANGQTGGGQCAAILLPLAMAVRQHPQLSKLYLSYNRLIDASSLQCVVSSLVELHLDHNQLTDTTAVSLAEALSNHNNNSTIATTRTTRLEILNLNSNRITNVGGVAIANALR